MKRRIEDKIPDAFNIIKQYYEAEKSKPENENYRIPKEFKGYISSLGASILMSGLLPTLCVYYSKSNRSKEDRSIVMGWVFEMVKPLHSQSIPKRDLFEYAREIMNDLTETNRLINDILDISVALKLTIRTFPLTK